MSHNVSSSDVSNNSTKSPFLAKQNVQSQNVPTFGYSLAQLSYEHSGTFKWAPDWLFAAIRELKQHGLKRSDLWTAVPREDEVLKLAQNLCNGEQIVWSQQNSLTIATIVKSFFQKLPTPLLTYELHDMWLGAAQNIFISKEQQMEYIKSVISALPPLNRTLLSELITLFEQAFDAEVNSRIIIPPIWGPILLLRKSAHDFKTSARESSRLIHILTVNRAELFATSQGLSATAGSLSSLNLHATNDSRPARTPRGQDDASSSSSFSSRTWLAKINKEKLSKIPMYLEQAISTANLMIHFATESKTDIEEFISNVSLMSHMLKCVQSKIESNKLPTCIVEIYHLERFYSLLNDLLDSWKQAYQGQNLVRIMKSTRVRGAFERVALYSHYELVLFFGMLNESYGIHLTSSLSNSRGSVTEKNLLINDRQFLENSQFYFDIDDADAKKMWISDCSQDGNNNGFFVSSWFGFSRAYQACFQKGHMANRDSNTVIDAETMQSLKLILDNNNTGFVSIFRYKEFLRGFGPFDKAPRKATDVAHEAWFHGYMSREESQKILEPCHPGTFLVRFSASQPGTVALTWVGENGDPQHTRLESTPQGFCLKTGGGLQYFSTISEIVSHYESLLRIPFTNKIMQYPAFYGDLSTEEVSTFLDQEPIGTYLVRFSKQKSSFTVSLISESGLSHVRLGRTPEGALVQAQQNVAFNSMEELVHACSDLFRFPYYNATSVSSIPIEDEERRSIKLLLQEDDGEDRTKIDYSANIVRQLLDDQTASTILASAISNLNNVAPVDLQLLTEYLSIQTQERTAKLFKTALKDEKNKQKKDDKIKRTVSGIFAKKDGFKCSEVRLEKTGVHLYKPTVFSFVISNTSKPINWKIRDPQVVNTHSFFSCSESTGVLEKGKSTTIQVCVVLYKPVVVERFLAIELTSSEGVVSYIPLYVKVAVSHEALKQEIEQEPYWKIALEEIIVENKIGGGASANVYKCNLYGATLALKRWDLGMKDHPPPDFLVELEMYKTLRHENLVFFVGGRAEIGKAFILTEFLKFGSLDTFMQNPPPGFTLTFQHKLSMAIDAAKGMRCVHRANKLHRDLKSLNLLVDDHHRIKVADFGEAKEKDSSNMTVAKGTYNWMAPEVMTGNYTLKADVFSFGIILWELLMQSLPDRDMISIQHGLIPPIPEDIRIKYADYVELLEACCRKSPNKRPSFNQIVLSLKHIRDFGPQGR